MPSINLATAANSISPGLPSDGIYAAGARAGSTASLIDGAAVSGRMPHEEVSHHETSPKASPLLSGGKLTSGEVNDFGKWSLWKDISDSELNAYSELWNLKPRNRYTVVVKNEQHKPVHNAHVSLKDKRTGVTLWEAMSDNTGKAELWANMFLDGSGEKNLYASVHFEGRNYTINRLRPFGRGINTISIAADCQKLKGIDVAFIVDATGSMGDEIDYLKAELMDIVKRVTDSLPGHELRIGSVFYRDAGDEYVTRVSPLDKDMNKVVNFIRSNGAGGGGDTPEAVEEALDAAFSKMEWKHDAIARIAFIILDAPPHGDKKVVAKIQALSLKYARHGIRLVPISCSGIDKNTEYLMRSMALATNGTYLFLTDHSGIGGSHIEPSTDKFDVEYMNMLVCRIIYQFSYSGDCDVPASGLADTGTVETPLANTDSLSADTTNKDLLRIKWKYYPNPSSGIIHVEHHNLRGDFFISDISGKLLLKIVADETGKSTVDVSAFPSGVYFIKYQYAPDKWLSGKFSLLH